MIEHIGDKSTHIVVVPDIVPLDICNDLVESCKRDWNKLFYVGPTLGGVDLSIKNTMDFDFSGQQAKEKGADYELYQYFENKIVESLWLAVSLYVEEYKELRLAPTLSDTGFRLQFYGRGAGFYRSHHDGAPWDPEPTSLRCLGAVVYLNTVERGGETAFPMHGEKIKARAGSISLFPASWTHPHNSCVPISSDKWIVSSFIITQKRQPSLYDKREQSQSVPDLPTTLIDTNPENQSNDDGADK